MSIKLFSTLVLTALLQPTGASLRVLQETTGSLNTTGFNTTDFNSTDYDPALCGIAYDELMNDSDVASANAMFMQSLLGACNTSTGMDEICVASVGWTSSDIKMDACSMESYDMYKEACGAAGASFCSLDGTADGEIGAIGGLLTYKMKLDLACIATCIPMECNPDMLEQGGVMGAIKEYLTSELGFDLSQLTTQGSITCMDSSGTIVAQKRGVILRE